MTVMPMLVVLVTPIVRLRVQERPVVMALFVLNLRLVTMAIKPIAMGAAMRVTV